MKKILGVISDLVIIMSLVGAVFCIKNPYWKGNIASKDTYVLTTNADKNAYCLTYTEKGERNNTEIKRDVEKYYSDIDINRHFVVVNYPTLSGVGHTTYSTLGKDIVWVDYEFQGNVGEELIYNTKTHEAIKNTDNIMIVPNGIKFISVGWLMLWTIIGVCVGFVELDYFFKHL